MCRRIDRVESVGHYGYGRQSGFQGRAVGRNVYPVGQTAHNHRFFSHDIGELSDEALGEIAAVGRGVAGADYRDHTSAVEVAVAQHVEHQRGVVALEKAMRIVRIAEIDGADGV